MMASFIIYIIRWAVCLTLLYSLFGLFLKRETLHSVNRLVLLFVLAASMVLPLCQIETGSKNIVTQSREMVEHQIVNVQNPLSDNIKRITITNPENGMRYTHIPIRDDVNAYILIAIAIYLAGLVVCWLRYAWQMAALLLLIHRSNRIKTEGVPRFVHVVVNPSVKAPCSWMRWIILNPADVNTRAIINHELSHIHYGHSWDMVLCELTCRMLWCVPFAWMLRQDLRDVHEFQADRSVLQSGINENEYQLLLIRKATSTGLQPVVNALNQSPIKRRFKMMYRKPSRRWVALKAAYLLPLSALALVAFARPQTLGEIEKHVELSAPAVAETFSETVKTVTQQLPSLVGKGGLLGQASLQDERGVESATPTAEHPDSNLVKADIADSGAVPETVSDTTSKVLQSKTPIELLDSTMQAVGARKIGEGIYLGHFQPRLSSDTVRIARATILDRESKQTGEHHFALNTANSNAYNITLNAETRKDRSGYYIRYLQPVSSTQRNYDKKVVDPYMLSTDSVLTGRSSNLLHTYMPAAIEHHKKETRVYIYTAFKGRPQVDVWRQQNINNYSYMAIVDERTGDKYVCRSTDYDYFKYVRDMTINYVKDGKNLKDTIAIYQTCLVFPPLGKKVKEAHFGSIENDGRYSNTFKVNELPRKGRVITQ